MIRSHKIQLDPTVKQARYFSRAAGTARFTWNWALAKWNELYKAGNKPKATELKKLFNSVKYDQFPWLKEIHRDAHSQPFANLQKAFVSFFKRLAKHPTFKKRGKSRDSFYVANDRFHLDGYRITLPVIGSVRMIEPLRFQGKITSAVVSREADRWFISIAVEVPFSTPIPPTGHSVGIDVGLHTFATLSTGEKVDSPKPLKEATKRLRRASRRHSRKQKGSSNRRKASTRLAKVHRSIRNIRKDFLHKLTTKLTKTHSQIGIEDLNVKGMVKNHKLAKAISDASWFEFRRQLTYKTVLYGSKLVVHDRFYPSSKACSRCGYIVEELPLSVREWNCPECGTEHDRDINAAKNLKPTTDGLSGSNASGEGCSKGLQRKRNYTVAHSQVLT
jgi:putative transposase